MACSTVTVTKCLAALKTLQAFPFFRPTCLCKEPGLDPECNNFQDFLFDHPCGLVRKKGTPISFHFVLFRFVSFRYLLFNLRKAFIFVGRYLTGQLLLLLFRLSWSNRERSISHWCITNMQSCSSRMPTITKMHWTFWKF